MSFHTQLPAGLKKDYELNLIEDKENVLKGLLLSPRSTYISHRDKRRKEGITTCDSCKNSLLNSRMPKFAIANGFYCGSPPSCLLELTDTELVFLTPAKAYGYCFVYTGGFQKQLKGNLCFYKREVHSIARAACHFDVLGLTDNIVILLNGKMTTDQKVKAKNKSKIRTSKILAAMKWLASWK